MAGLYNVIWTLEAKKQVDEILEYLRNNWSEKECSDFLDLTVHFQKTISLFPRTFKVSKKYKNCRLGLIHKHITAIYKISRRQISIVTIADNRSNRPK